MDRLHIYTWNYNIEEMRGYACFENYAIVPHELSLVERFEDRGYAAEKEEPSLFVFRVSGRDTGLWRFIRGIQERYRNATSLLLISEPDFSICYGALRHGVTAVQMEPATKQEMEDRIWQCLRLMQGRSRSIEDRRLLEDYEYEKQHRVMERILAAILERPYEMEQVLPEMNRRYHTRFGEGSYQAFVISVNNADLCGKNSHFLKELSLRAMHTIGLAKEIVVGYKEPYGMIGIAYYGKSLPLAERRGEFAILAKVIRGMQAAYGEFQVTLGVGCEVNGIAEIGRSLSSAAYTQEYRMTTGQQILFAEEIYEDRELEEFMPERKLRELLRFVLLGDVRHVNGWFLEFHQAVEPKFWQYPPAFAKLTWEVYQLAGKQGMKDKFPEWKFLKLQYIFDGMERNRQLEILLLEICHMMQQDSPADQELATEAIAYMKVHYAEPINLDYMAEKCGLSTSYFSRKFKEQTGEKYIDVLTDIRVREAQRLLATTRMSVLEIVEAVGYCDDKHFRRIFTKITGMKPLEYRKSMVGEFGK